MELEEGKRERCHAEAKKTRSVGGRCPTGYFIKKKTLSRRLRIFLPTGLASVGAMRKRWSLFGRELGEERG